MSDSANTPGSLRPGGRTARTRAAVLDAVLAELGETGYGGLTMENVARRSGVHVATVYRRWRTVEGLIIDLLTLLGATEVPFPDTGSLSGDLRGLSRSIVALYVDNTRIRSLVESVVASATKNARAAEALHDFFALRSERAAVIVERAVERGELPPDTDGVELIAAMAAPIYYRMLVSRKPIDTALADRTANATYVAALSGVFSTSGFSLDAPKVQ
ncbi:TetR/AcrR family transcriptional regulator [Embleya sp. NBC_00896]|uniref:TetR/AcrR family transcriptional regulator n=1 Tax=Embleya sp. NBC_00896 TaxID=2975961 RepID=UPI003868D906|nr:TetR/AcrR family transcriptional regulator [Embleya sp. NBC_00896]